MDLKGRSQNPGGGLSREPPLVLPRGGLTPPAPPLSPSLACCGLSLLGLWLLLRAFQVSASKSLKRNFAILSIAHFFKVFNSHAKSRNLLFHNVEIDFTRVSYFLKCAKSEIKILDSLACLKIRWLYRIWVSSTHNPFIFLLICPIYPSIYRCNYFWMFLHDTV